MIQALSRMKRSWNQVFYTIPFYTIPFHTISFNSIPYKIFYYHLYSTSVYGLLHFIFSLSYISVSQNLILFLSQSFLSLSRANFLSLHTNVQSLYGFHSFIIFTSFSFNSSLYISKVRYALVPEACRQAVFCL